MSKSINLLIFALFAIIACYAGVANAQSPSEPTTTEAPRQWYVAWVNGTSYTTVNLQNAFQSQFSSLNLGTWFITTYPDPPAYDSATNGFAFKFCFSSGNAVARQNAFENYRGQDATLAGLKSECTAKSITLWAIAPTATPVDTTPSPSINHQWYKVSVSGETYDNTHFQQCLVNTLQVLAGCVLQTLPSDPTYDAPTNSVNFTFGFYGENYVRNQNALTNYLNADATFSSLYAACATPSIKIKVVVLQLTATPDAFTNPPTGTPSPGSNDGNGADNNKPLIPGLENWMSFTLIGVVSFAVVGVIVFVILSYCRAQQEGEAEGEKKNVKFDSRKQAQVSAQELAYQRADVQSA